MRLAALAVAVPLLSGCGGEGALRLTEADSGETISLGEGERVVVELDSNPSTGYAWNLVEEPDAGVLRVVDSEYQADEEGPDAPIGSGGTERWTFEAAGEGTTGLHLRYFFQDEPDQDAGDFRLTSG